MSRNICWTGKTGLFFHVDAATEEQTGMVTRPKDGDPSLLHPPLAMELLSFLLMLDLQV